MADTPVLTGLPVNRKLIMPDKALAGFFSRKIGDSGYTNRDNSRERFHHMICV
jgi:hypothetical protein